MKKYSVRPATPRDVEAVHALIAAQNINDFGEAMLTVDDLRTSWKDLKFENETCMAYAGGELAGYAELKDGESPFIYLSDPHDVDLGFQLLTILEEIAFDHKTVRLSTRVSASNQTLSELFIVNGYHATHSFLIMELVMREAPPVPQWPQGISVRTFNPGQDEHATFLADEESAQDKGYHEPLDFDGWSKRMGLGSERFDPSIWFLAFDGVSAEIAGLALNAYQPGSDTAWVDHLSVRRPWRKRGIGKALLLHTFGEFYGRGILRMKLSVDSKSLTHAPGLYESVGMKTIHEYYIYRKELQM
jgi:GNAT superfamily N-acetyltransferase